MRYMIRVPSANEFQSMQKQRGLDLIIKYRYLIGLAIVLIAVIFDLNGSSISLFNTYLGTSDTGLILGKARSIRSDEWAIFTPFAIAQGSGDKPYQWVNSVIRGTATDMFVVYAQPVLNFFGIIFRPFMNGYLLFGSERGAAFFWSARLVALWLTYYEFFTWLTEKNLRKREDAKTGSDKHQAVGAGLLGSFMITFAPVVQWWFAINGFVEMLIFGAWAVMLLDRFLTAGGVLCLVGMYICAGGYVMTFYPASMVPLAYVYAALAVWVVIEDRDSLRHPDKWAIIGFIIMVAAFGLTMLYIFGRSWDAISSVLNTAYPGKRVSQGGDGLKYFGMSWGNLFTPFRELTGVADLNESEAAVFFDLFPLGILLSVVNMIRRRRLELLDVLLMAVMLMLSIYCILGMPLWLAKITMLSHITANRAYSGIGLINVILLVRSIFACEAAGDAISQIDDVSGRTTSCNRKISLYVAASMTAAVYAAAVCAVTSACYNGYISRKMLLVVAAGAFALAFMLVAGRRRLFMCAMVAAMLLMGATVNPMQQGFGDVLDNDLADAISGIVEQDPDGLWMVEGDGFPMTNYTIMLGAPTINCTNTYPVLSRWQQFDPEGLADYYYNRYAQICIHIIAEDDERDALELNSADDLQVYARADEIADYLQVKYIMTPNDLKIYNTDSVSFNMIAEAQGYKIYECIY